MKKIVNNYHPMNVASKTFSHSITRRQFIGNVAVIAAGATLSSATERKEKASLWQFGCYTRPWGQYDYRVAFDGIAEAGFKNAALMTAKGGLVMTHETTPERAAAIGEEAKSRGLQISEVFCGNYDVRISVANGITQLKQMIDNTSACGSPSLMLGGIDAPELVDAYYKAVAECCDYAADKGVRLSIKQHGGTNTKGIECRRHIEKVNHRNFKLLFDPGNVYYYTDGKLDPVDDANDVDGLVVGLCVKDFLMPKEVNVTPGTGMVDFPKLFARLKKGGFTHGPLIVECFSINGNLSYVNAESKKSYQFLKELTQQIDKKLKNKSSFRKVG